MDDLIQRLREPYEQRQSRRVADEFQAADRIEALERQVKAADALAEALTPFAVTLERYSGFTEYALFGIWEDVNGAAGRKLNILRMANFDDAKAALAAYRATKRPRHPIRNHRNRS